jgi:two-component system, NtrC family, response regulator AtoC
MSAHKILIVDDDGLQRWPVREQLRRWGYAVLEADNGAAALEAFRAHHPDVVLLDLRLGAESGLDVLKQIKGIDPAAAVMMVTAHGDLDDAVSGFRLGLTDFFRKPIDFTALRVALRYRLETERLREVANRSREAESAGRPIVGSSPALAAALHVMRKVAASNATSVLLEGESGTGKDLIAKAIHEASARRDEPFVHVNCAALPETLLESELFGHEKGAFTDARAMKRGMFELAAGGSLYLDEIGELKLPLQAKLLRAIEELSFRRLGGVSDITVDTRIIAATNRNLAQAVKEGAFRPDLYYRLRVVHIVLPPLRERREDIPVLVEHLVRQLAARLGRPAARVAPDAMAALCRYQWPGNVRELRNALERSLILEDGDLLTVGHLGDARETASPDAASAGEPFHLPPGGVSLERVEESLVRQAMAQARGNQTKAAKLLDISRDTLRYKLKKLGMTEREHADDPVADDHTA